jgi:hypothetical protein
MRNRLPLAIISFLLASDPLAAAVADWKVLPIRSKEEFDLGRIGGESEQHLHGIARCLGHPERIYLAHDVGQTWKSTNGGGSWRKAPGKNLPLFSCLSIEADPVNADVLFLMTDPNYDYMIPEALHGVYRSKDGGESWERVLTLDTEYKRMVQHAIDYDPASIAAGGAKVWYAATPASGLFRSADGGTTWIRASAFTGVAMVYDVECHPTDGTTVYAATSAGLLASADRGAGMALRGNLPAGEVTSIEIDPSNPARMYAVVYKKGLYRTTAGADGFSLVKAFDASRVFMNPGFPDTLYLVGVDSNTITSHDGGATWITDMRTVPFPGLGRQGGWKGRIAGDLSGIVPNPRSRDEAVGYSRASLWKTTDGGKTFVECSTMFTGFSWGWWSCGIAFDANDPKRFATFNCDVGPAITSAGGDWFVRSGDDQVWSWYTQGLIGWIGSNAGAIQPVQGSGVIVASVGDYFKAQLMRTEDAGATWRLVTSGSANVESNLFIAFHPKDPSLVYAGNKVSRDAGKTFSLVDFGTFAADKPSILGMCLANPDVVYAMDAARRKILRSDDQGKTWRLYVEPGWPFKRLDSLPTFAVDPADPDRVYTLRKDDLASFDGSAWRTFGVLPLAGGAEVGNFVRSVAVDPRHPEVIYAATWASGYPCVFRSVNGGAAWEDITSNSPRIGAAAIAVHPHTGELLRGSVAGTWIYPAPYESTYSLYDKAVAVASQEGRGGQKQGDANQDAQVDLADSIWIIGGLFIPSEASRALPCEGGTMANPGPGELKLLDFNGDGSLDIGDAIGVADFLFIGNRSPSLGTECVAIDGCPDTCP